MIDLDKIQNEVKPKEIGSMNQEKYFHIWQIANTPKFSKAWHWISGQEAFIDAVNDYNILALDANTQFKNLVNLAESLLVKYNNNTWYQP